MKRSILSLLLVIGIASLCSVDTDCNSQQHCNSNGFCVLKYQVGMSEGNLNEGQLAGFSLAWIFGVGIIYTVVIVSVCCWFRNRRKQFDIHQGQGIQMSRVPVQRQNTIEMDIDGHKGRYEELMSRGDKPSIASGAQSRRRRQYTEAELNPDTQNYIQ